MWICLNNAYLSIVEPTCTGEGMAPQLLVRARRPGDIERVFGSAVSVETKDGRDYMFRARVDRKQVADAISAQVLGIDYGNFKNSVKDEDLHDAYAGFWHLMARVQPQRPYSHYSRAAAQRKPVQTTFSDLGGLPARKPRAKRSTVGA